MRPRNSGKSPMKTLLLMRHGKSSWDEADATDHDRTLNPRGLRDAPRMGRLLREEGLVPDQIVTSSATRARTTAELVAEECGLAEHLEVTSLLYHAHIAEWLEVLHRISPAVERLLCVGHNPGLEEFASALTRQHLQMPTAAITRLDLAIDDWPELACDCEVRDVEFWCPKELD